MPGLIRTEIDKNNPLSSIGGYDPERVTLGTDDTVAGQINKVIGADSPLMESARTRAAQGMNSRGLLNTTMAQQAGEKAVIDSALPIAAADAQTNFQAKGLNQAAGNRGSEFTATATNTAALNERQGQQAIEQQTQKGQQTIEQMELKGIQDAELQTLKGNQAKKLAQIEGGYRELLQTSQMATTMLSGVQRAMDGIMANPNLDAKAKQKAIDKHTDLLEASLAIIGGVHGMPDLKKLLTF